MFLTNTKTRPPPEINCKNDHKHCSIVFARPRWPPPTNWQSTKFGAKHKYAHTFCKWLVTRPYAAEKNFTATFNNLWQRVFTKGYLFFIFSTIEVIPSSGPYSPSQPLGPESRNASRALRDSNPTNSYRSLRSYPSFTSSQFQFQLVILQSALLLLRWRIHGQSMQRYQNETEFCLELTPLLLPVYAYSLLKVPFILRV